MNHKNRIRCRSETSERLDVPLRGGGVHWRDVAEAATLPKPVGETSERLDVPLRGGSPLAGRSGSGNASEAGWRDIGTLASSATGRERQDIGTFGRSATGRGSPLARRSGSGNASEAGWQDIGTLASSARGREWRDIGTFGRSATLARCRPQSRNPPRARTVLTFHDALSETERFHRQPARSCEPEPGVSAAG